MKVSDILTDEDLGEVWEVPNEKYPFGEMSKKWLSDKASAYIESRQPDKTTSEYEIYRLDNLVLLTVQGKPVGKLDLMGKSSVGESPYGVMDVFILPEYRNLRLGLAMYNYILKDRGEAFEVSAAQTPYSQRLWCSLWRDPELDVYALGNDDSRHEVYPQGGKLISDTIDVWGKDTRLVAEKK